MSDTNLFFNEGHFRPGARTLLFFILSLGLLILYGWQKKEGLAKATSNIIIWSVTLVILSVVSYYGPSNGFLNTLILVLFGVSAGMTASDAQIKIS